MVRISYQLSVISYQLNEPMARHTSFEIGGVVDFFVAPANIEELLSALKDCCLKDLPLQIIGNGSNLLVSDKGIRGVVVSLLGLRNIELFDGKIRADAGVSMEDLAEFAAGHGIAGFEFAHGIPGSVGGGVFMNAGAYEGEIADVFCSAECIDANNELIILQKDDMNFGYRKSAAQERGLVVASAVFSGRAGDAKEIWAKMDELRHQRESKQPLEMPSAGSIFKRPPGMFAGKLIMDAGLRGHSVGGAQVSEKHCGFIVNKGGATAADVLGLIKHIQQTVQDKFGVWLETEVKMIGEF